MFLVGAQRCIHYHYLKNPLGSALVPRNNSVLEWMDRNHSLKMLTTKGLNTTLNLLSLKYNSCMGMYMYGYITKLFLECPLYLINHYRS